MLVFKGLWLFFYPAAPFLVGGVVVWCFWGGGGHIMWLFSGFLWAVFFTVGALLGGLVPRGLARCFVLHPGGLVGGGFVIGGGVKA